MGIRVDENLYLEKLKRQDVDKMTEWAGYEDKLFSDYNFPQLNEREKTLWYNIKTGPNRICYGIHKNQILVGYISVRNIDKWLRLGELGLVIDSSYINERIGSKILPVFLDYYIKKLGYKYIFLRVASFNDRAKKLYINNGFKTIHTYYDEIDIDCNIIEEERYKRYKHLFKRSNGRCECEFQKMILSTKSTSKMGKIVDKFVDFIVKLK